MNTFAAITLGVCCLAFPAAAQPAARVQADLLADTTALAPGSTFTLGVRLTIPEGWHVYWKNPGDAGLPTEVALGLAEAFTAESVEFPSPHRFVQPGDVVGFGYSGSVLLTVRITAPQKLGPGPIPFTANVSWLVCDGDRCLPDEAAVSLSLPVGPTAQRDHAELFQRWQAEMPVPPSARQMTATVNRTQRGPRKRTVTLTLTAPSALTPPDVFPATPQGLSVSDVHTTATGNTTTVRFSVSIDQRPHWPEDPMEVLLSFDTGPAVRVLVPLAGPAKPLKGTTP